MRRKLGKVNPLAVAVLAHHEELAAVNPKRAGQLIPAGQPNTDYPMRSASLVAYFGFGNAERLSVPGYQH